MGDSHLIKRSKRLDNLEGDSHRLKSLNTKRDKREMRKGEVQLLPPCSSVVNLPFVVVSAVRGRKKAEMPYRFPQTPVAILFFQKGFFSFFKPPVFTR